MDPGTGLTILGTAIGGAKVLEKVLGPTADYIGTGLREFTERRVENITNILKVTKRLLGDDIDEPGQVPPKMLKLLLDDGSFCDDPLAAEYFGGIVASSRTVDNRDDRAVALAAMVGRLSNFQIRCHYVFYRVLRGVLRGPRVNTQKRSDLKRAKTFIPINVFCDAMEWKPSTSLKTLMPHVLNGMVRELLIEDCSWGRTDVFALSQNTEGVINRPGVVFVPTTSGIELFIAAHGHKNSPVADFLDLHVDLETDVVIKPGSMTVQNAA